MAIHSSTLAWEILQTEKTGGLQSMRSQKSQTQLCNQTDGVLADPIFFSFFKWVGRREVHEQCLFRERRHLINQL